MGRVARAYDIRIFNNIFVQKRVNQGGGDFSFFRDRHFAIRNDVRYPLRGLAVDGNVFVWASNSGSMNALIDVGEVHNFSFSHNQSMDANSDNGPNRVFTGLVIQGIINGNHLRVSYGVNAGDSPPPQNVVMSSNIIEHDNATPFNNLDDPSNVDMGNIPVF